MSRSRACFHPALNRREFLRREPAAAPRRPGPPAAQPAARSTGLPPAAVPGQRLRPGAPPCGPPGICRLPPAGPGLSRGLSLAGSCLPRGGEGRAGRGRGRGRGEADEFSPPRADPRLLRGARALASSGCRLGLRLVLTPHPGGVRIS